MKLLGGAEVTVVWANAPPVERAQVESNAARRRAADRYEDITILVKARTQMPGCNSTACYTVRPSALRHEAENAVIVKLKIGHVPHPAYTG
ncbi:hypothetical protein GCM10007857_36840 [Bradyrhizobium iriomotense]|uniref:Uncharacterized protein n=1 Tax=Bradyrhizobium iriomotense TaxID=441950 RepID=A0ABQ6AZH8_9BRAD|nr:hypothetical protein GCM10007857_36840 [Bradyrhizobium iriomotense]